MQILYQKRALLGGSRFTRASKFTELKYIQNWFFSYKVAHLLLHANKPLVTNYLYVLMTNSSPFSGHLTLSSCVLSAIVSFPC